MPANMENSGVLELEWKRSVFIPIPKKGSAKKCLNYHIIALTSHASKVILKILNNMWTVNYQMFKLDLEKAEEPRIKLTNPVDHWKNKRVPEKTSTSALLNMPKPLTVWITINCEQFWKRWEFQTISPAS